MANQILRKWTLDNQCQKSVVLVVATEDRRFWVARDSRVPVYAQEFTQIFNDQVNYNFSLLIFFSISSSIIYLNSKWIDHIIEFIIL